MAEQYGVPSWMTTDVSGPVANWLRTRSAQGAQFAPQTPDTLEQPVGDYARSLGMIEGTPEVPGAAAPDPFYQTKAKESGQPAPAAPAQTTLEEDIGMGPALGEIGRIRQQGNVTENRGAGLRGQEWLQSQGGGMSNWSDRMRAADSPSPQSLSAAQTGIDADWRASLADRYGTTEENTFDPRRQQLEDATAGLKLAQLGQQTQLAQMTPQELASLEQRPDARVLAFQFAQRVLGTPEQKEQGLLEAYATQFGRALTAQETAALKIIARKMWEKQAEQIYTQAQTQREAF